MVKKSKKSKSKRMPLKKKYKILRKVKEHHKKKAKEAKKLVGKKKPVEKDPGIPNSWPFKEQELAALETRRQRALDAVEKKKQEKKDRAAQRRAAAVAVAAQDDAEAAMLGVEEEEGEGGLLRMAAEAGERGGEYERREKKRERDEGDGRNAAVNDGSRRAFFRELQKVVDAADVVIQVLDARDPMGCRCLDVERMVVRSGANKRVVLLLNKIDLVPREVTEKWLKFLREELPTVAFKSSTQQQKTNLSQKKTKTAKKPSRRVRGGAAALEGSSSECLGADTLLQLLKNYARSQNIKTAITVGVVGLPNVGKSSLINSLKRSKVANVGATPGVTRAMQEVHLDRHVKLLDCPGIVFSSAEDEASAVLRNAVKVEKLVDPMAPVRQILSLCSAERLMAVYLIPKFGDADEFVRHVAVARGKLKKGGVPNTIVAARLILKDWNDGTIPFYTTPPKREGSSVDGGPKLVSEWGKEFDFEKLAEMEDADVLAKLSTDEGDALFSELPPSAPAAMAVEEMDEKDGNEGSDEDGEGGDMEEDEAVVTGLREKKGGDKTLQNEKLYDAEGIYNPHSARAEKKRKKKLKATFDDEGITGEKVAKKVSNEGNEEDSDYDFSTDFA